MFNHKQHKCISACKECAAACLRSAIACMQENDSDAMLNCIADDLDCAEMCILTIQAMLRGGKNLNAYYRMCADICQNMSLESADRELELCQFCADMRARCADACREVSISAVVAEER